jgi:hypothetical protein
MIRSPFPSAEGLRLVVNARGPGDSSIVVELLDAGSGKPLPGFTRGDRNPLTGDGLHSVVCWTAGDRLPADRGRVTFRFLLSGRQSRPKL